MNAEKDSSEKNETGAEKLSHEDETKLGKDEGVLELFLKYVDAEFKKAKLIAQEHGPELYRQAKRRLFHYCKMFVLTFLATIPFLSLGIWLENKTIIVMTGVIRAAITIPFFAIVGPLGVAIVMTASGIRGSVRYYAQLVIGAAIGEIILALILAWLPLKNNLDGVFPFVVTLSVFSALLSRFANRQVGTFIISVLLILNLSSFFIPYTMQSWMISLFHLDQQAGLPIRVDDKMTCAGIKNEPFFGPDGQPLRYYYFNARERTIEVYKLTSKSKMHPRYGHELKPMTGEVISSLENQICRKEAEKRRAALDAESARQAREEKAARLEAEKRAQEAANAKKAREQAALATKQQQQRQNEQEKTRSNKAYRCAIYPASSTGPVGKHVCRQIADSNPSYVNASDIDYDSARQKAHYVVVVDEVIVPPAQQVGVRVFACRALIRLKVIEGSTGRVWIASKQTHLHKAHLM